jgi:hypothetical protein
LEDAICLTLTPGQEILIQSQVTSSYYESPSQVTDAALKLLELEDAASPFHRLDTSALRSNVLDGLD